MTTILWEISFNKYTIILDPFQLIQMKKIKMANLKNLSVFFYFNFTQLTS